MQAAIYARFWRTRLNAIETGGGTLKSRGLNSDGKGIKKKGNPEQTVGRSIKTNERSIAY